jgi:hypothetical protein
MVIGGMLEYNFTGPKGKQKGTKMRKELDGMKEKKNNGAKHKDMRKMGDKIAKALEEDFTRKDVKNKKKVK